MKLFGNKKNRFMTFPMALMPREQSQSKPVQLFYSGKTLVCVCITSQIYKHIHINMTYYIKISMSMKYFYLVTPAEAKLN